MYMVMSIITANATSYSRSFSFFFGICNSVWSSLVSLVYHLSCFVIFSQCGQVNGHTLAGSLAVPMKSLQSRQSLGPWFWQKSCRSLGFRFWRARACCKWPDFYSLYTGEPLLPWSLCLQCFDLKCRMDQFITILWQNQAFKATGCHYVYERFVTSFLMSKVWVEGWIGWISHGRSPDTSFCLPQNHLAWSDTGSNFGKKNIHLKNYDIKNGSLICFFSDSKPPKDSVGW